MDELIAFLRARLDEDERIAKAASPGPWEGVETGAPHYRDARVYDVAGDPVASFTRVYPECAIDISDEDMRHIARHDPARALADVATKRAIVDAWPDPFGNWTAPQAEAARQMKRTVLAKLALTYADHPDYQAAWRP